MSKRKVTKDIRRCFDEVRALSRKYDGSMDRVESIEMWEGTGDDRTADMQFVAKVLETKTDVDGALRQINRLARKYAVFVIEPDFREVDYWKAKIGEVFYVGRAREENGLIEIIGIPNVNVNTNNVKVTGAGTEDERWKQIQRNTVLVKKRVLPRPAHDRTALIACYGPSLKDTWELMADQAKRPGFDLVSVSGSHDFCVERGMIPRYHVECDPREHKADNIAAGHPDVAYLIASQAHPALIHKLKGMDIALWHVSCDLNYMIVDTLGESFVVAGGGSVGLRSIGLLYDMGYRVFDIHGMDCSIAQNGERWAGKHAKKSEAAQHETYKIAVGNREYETTPVLAKYAGNFFDTMRRIPDATFRLYGDGLLQNWVFQAKNHATAKEAA